MSASSRIQSSRISPTHSRSSLRTSGLLTFIALALGASAAPPLLSVVPTKDQKVVRRWNLTGGPRGVALGANGTVYVGLADRQSVVAIDPKSGSIRRELVLDSAEIAATKELVTMRTNAKRTRLYIANGSDESATILSLPDLNVVREITMEGEAIRDVLPDPKGRYIYLLGRRVHVFNADGASEIHTLPLEQPMAIATTSNGQTLAVFGTEDFGNTKATVVATYDTTTFKQISREPLQTDETIDAAMFAPGDSALVALSRDHVFEQQKKVVNSERICLPDGSGPQIALIDPSSAQLLFAERRCASSTAFAGATKHITPASIYGVNAYALAYDDVSNTVIATDKSGYLTIYKAPRK